MIQRLYVTVNTHTHKKKLAFDFLFQFICKNKCHLLFISQKLIFRSFVNIFTRFFFHWQTSTHQKK